MVTIKVPFFRRADFLIPIAIATALIISVSVVSAVDLERGLVAYYSFDDCSAKDLSGNGNDGIIYGAKCVDGKFGKALSFDGVNDYVRVPSIVPSSSEGTFMAWVKPNSIHIGHIIYIGQSTGNGFGGEEELHLSTLDNGMFSLFFGSGFINNLYYRLDGGSYTAGNWYHVVGVYKNGDFVRLYVNGQLVLREETDQTIDTSNWVPPTLIGKPRANERYFNGIIDEVRIYNRALSEEEIRALYERGVAPRPKLAIEMDIDTSLKQGEVRKGTIRVENIGNSDAKSIEVRLFSEGLGVDMEKSYAKIPSGEAREFLFEVSANDAGTFKLSAYAEYWDDKGNKYVETADKFVHVEAVVLPTSQPTSQAPKTPEARETARPAGFYAIFASLLIAVSYFLIRLGGKKN